MPSKVPSLPSTVCLNSFTYQPTDRRTYQCIDRLIYLRIPTDVPADRFTDLATYLRGVLCLYGFILVYGEKLKDGRWAYTEIPKERDGNPGKLDTDVYGKLRPRCNTNDRA